MGVTVTMAMAMMFGVMSVPMMPGVSLVLFLRFSMRTLCRASALLDLGHSRATVYIGGRSGC